MTNGPVPPPSAPWQVYARTARLPSREHMLLSEALAALATAQIGIGADDVVRAFTSPRPDFIELSDREDVEALISRLHRLLVEGGLVAAVRAFGGGLPRALPTRDWEIDDPLPRFARSSMDPAAPFDPDADPTHWILVPRRPIEAMVAGEADAEPGDAPPPSAPSPTRAEPIVAGAATSPLVAGAPSPAPTVAGVGAFLRREEVLRLTGFRKSKLYEKIAAGTFPAQVAMGPRMSRWRESDVARWLRDPT